MEKFDTGNFCIIFFLILVSHEYCKAWISKGQMAIFMWMSLELLINNFNVKLITKKIMNAKYLLTASFRAYLILLPLNKLT